MDNDFGLDVIKRADDVIKQTEKLLERNEIDCACYLYKFFETGSIIYFNNYKAIFDNLDATHNIPANSTKKICVQLGHVTVDKLQYTDKPRLDLYFTNENEIFTLSINKPAE